MKRFSFIMMFLSMIAITIALAIDTGPPTVMNTSATETYTTTTTAVVPVGFPHIVAGSILMVPQSEGIQVQVMTSPPPTGNSRNIASLQHAEASALTSSVNIANQTGANHSDGPPQLAIQSNIDDAKNNMTIKSPGANYTSMVRQTFTVNNRAFTLASQTGQESCAHNMPTANSAEGMGSRYDLVGLYILNTNLVEST